MVRETEHDQLSGNMATALQSHDGFDNAVPVIVGGGYIRVIQDVRGKYGSEGDFVMNRPLRGPLSDTPVDEAETRVRVDFFTGAYSRNGVRFTSWW